MGNVEGSRVLYPSDRRGADLRQNRTQLLNKWRLNDNRLSATSK